MYLSLMAVLVDVSTQERRALPLLAPGLDGAAQMLRKAHPHLSLLALYERDTLNHWLSLLRAHPEGAGEVPVIQVHVHPNDPLEQSVPVVIHRPADEVRALPDTPDPADRMMSRSMIEGFVRTLDHLEQCCMRRAA